MSRRRSPSPVGRPRLVGANAAGLFLVMLLGTGVFVAAPRAQSTSTALPLRTVVIDGARIAYRDVNRSTGGTPLLLIIGYGSTMTEWDPAFVTRLASQRRVILFDNRAIGNSTGSATGLTVTEMAKDTAGLVKHLKLRQVDVLGWSMGGFIAQQLTLAHPRLVRRLVLVSTDPGSPASTVGNPTARRVLSDPTSTPSEKLPILFPADQQESGRAWLLAVGRQPGLTAADFQASPQTLAAQKLATTIRWLRPGQGTLSRLAQIRARTLIAYGTRDVIVPPANALLMQKKIPHAQTMRVSDGGHAFLFQNPTGTAAAFARFLLAR